jgi:hypothetical protein
MRALLVGAGLFAIITVAACDDSTSPKFGARLVPIAAIDAPASTTPTDSLKLSFMYYPLNCDTGAFVSVRQYADTIRFSAMSYQTTKECPNYPTASLVANTQRFGYIAVPPHAAPLHLIFSQPDGRDSTRLVAAVGGATGFPPD